MGDLLQHDVRHLGRRHVICCYELGDVIVDPGPESTVETLLSALEGREPRAILLTHVHLDHAGATGALVRRWPTWGPSRTSGSRRSTSRPCRRSSNGRAWTATGRGTAGRLGS